MTRRGKLTAKPSGHRAEQEISSTSNHTLSFLRVPVFLCPDHLVPNLLLNKIPPNQALDAFGNGRMSGEKVGEEAAHRDGLKDIQMRHGGSHLHG